MTTSISVSRDVTAAPERVWELISDLPRMGEVSPENTGGRWLGGATGPARGARFRGSNRNGKHRWNTMVTVTTCDPGKTFEFEVKAAGVKVARWTYTLEPTESGCRVTETWTDQRGALSRMLGGPVSGVADRTEHNRSGMETTLANLAAAAERGDT